MRHKIKPTNFLVNVALRFSYDGTKFGGLVRQINSNTVEEELQTALINSQLISSPTKISFAGRTDAGVSAKDMVCSLFIEALPSYIDEETSSILKKRPFYNYDSILNSHLPSTITITGFSFVNYEFSARFDCKLRKYKYFFIKNNLNILKMQEACFIFQNNSNFKNFCKKKEEKLEYFIRPLKSIKILENDICYLEIQSVSFLHNMVRKIFWTLQQIGRNKIGLEEVQGMFYGDSKVGTSKPEYLLFVGAEYEPELEFISSIKHREEDYLVSEIQKDIKKSNYEKSLK